MQEHTAVELARGIRAGEFCAVEVATAYIDRIQALDASVHAFLWVEPERVLDQARGIDRRRQAGEDPGSLAGVPVAIKDNLCLEGVPTTCASRILARYVPPYTATAVQRLIDRGAVILGKTNLDEFAMGSSTEHSAFGPTRNPWDLDRVPGGSSGGSAAAVAAGLAPAALGSDTGGSIRQPAALCGVTGLKPTYGRVSRYGLVAFASSLDQIGPIGRTAEDCAAVLEAIQGHDPLDSTSARDVPQPVDLGGRIDGSRVGVPRRLLEELSSPMRGAFEQACAAFQDLGAVLQDVELPPMDHALAAYYIIAPAEASSNLARYDGVRYGHRCREARDVVEMFKETRREGFGPEVKRRIMLGTYALSSGYYDAYYLKAQKARTVLRTQFDGALEGVDILLMPATPTPAFPVGAKADPLEMYLSDIYTVALNLVGLPGLVVPAAPVDELPTGIQLVGRPWDEGTLLRLGHAFQQVTDFHLRRPPLKAAV
ncbi:MAG: Asp-tRNA(Asn)/Glu-tRNA(Gln) amidotransferase subunit GatA [Armatimonadetes bacterium]|nr:Asp-tRNA(Asn)/Glu-tRNA(Gln) amidotransferase subunit GatA [Armatimonadota bacterium]